MVTPLMSVFSCVKLALFLRELMASVGGALASGIFPVAVGMALFARCLRRQVAKKANAVALNASLLHLQTLT
jgi:hypothetical protein